MGRLDNWFSNFKPLDEPFIYEGITYHTVEHFFQAMKAQDLESRRWIANQPTPAAAKKAGRRVILRSDWEKIKLSVMEYALRVKFFPGTSWHRILMQTEGEIVEWNDWGDRYWGKTLDGIGENHLGKILMKLRQEYEVLGEKDNET